MTDGTQTTASTADEYRVVVFATADNPHQFRDLLVDRLSMHPIDAMVLVHATPGILPERFSREQATQLAAAIEELGISAEVVGAADIPDFSGGENFHNVRIEDDGLVLMGVKGERQKSIAWNDVEMISVGQIPGEETRHFHFANDNIVTAARRRYIAPDELAGTPTMAVWILCEECNCGYRLEETHMNFSDLGDRMSPSATVNFRLFVEEIVTRSSDAFLTPATRTFLGHGSLRHFQFSSDEELKRYTVFHLLLRERLRKL